MAQKEGGAVIWSAESQSGERKWCERKVLGLPSMNTILTGLSSMGKLAWDMGVEE